MILGVGSDLIHIDRIARVFDRFNDRFKRRVFTNIEQKKAQTRKDKIGTYAKRWAAKEACSKALGTGLQMGISWKDMGVNNLPSGQPVMQLTGWARQKLDQMTPQGQQAIIYMSLSDDYPFAQAFVVIVAKPLTPSNN